eukprot:431355_1
MTLLHLLVGSIAAVHGIDYSETIWRTANITLPVRDGPTAIGTYGGSIFLVGGYSHPQQLTQFKIATNEIIDHGNKFYSQGQFMGQYYTQLNDLLFVIYGPVNYLNVFDLSTQTTHQQNFQTIPQNTGYKGCLTAATIQSVDYLFVVGGQPPGLWLDTVQILNVLSLNWIQNTPPMIKSRGDCACIVHSKTNQLFAIGGQRVNDGYLVFNEKLYVGNMSNISNKQWISIDDLIYRAHYPRAVIFEDDILVIGGTNHEFMIHELQIIHTVDDTVSLGSDMRYGIYSSSAINVDNIIYVFGGDGIWEHDQSSGYYVDTMQYIDLNPTEMPTVSPSADSETDEDQDGSGGSIMIIIVIVAAAVIVIVVLMVKLQLVCRKRKKSISNVNDNKTELETITNDELYEIEKQEPPPDGGYVYNDTNTETKSMHNESVQTLGNDHQSKSKQCISCKATNSSTAQFCDQCGNRLDAEGGEKQYDEGNITNM